MSPVGVAQARGTLALVERETRRVLSLWTQTILPPALTAVLFFGVIGGVLGDRIGEIEGVPYLDFILPGLLVLTAASPCFANASTSLFQAKSEGYIDDLLSSPLRGWQLATAYVAGSLLRGGLATALVVATAAGFVRPVERPWLAATSLLVTGLLFSSLGVITGVWADTFDQHSFIANIVITPLVVVAGVFYSVDALSDPWAALTRFDPLFYLVDATRAGFTGVSESPVGVSLGVAALAAMLAFALAASLFGKGWRLRP